MPYFPFFIELKDRRGVIVGGGTVAERKAEILVGFGAEILVVAPRVSQGLLDFYTNGKILLEQRDFKNEDLDGAFFVVAATDDPVLNSTIARLARESGVLINVVDSPAECSFIFPALIKEGDLTVAVSTSGACPAAAKTIRNRIKEVLPPDIGSRIAALKETREQLIRENAENRSDILSDAMGDLLK
jgi:siroheme synthase-like protein